MSVKLVITYLVVLTLLNGLCDSDSNITREAADVNSVHSSLDHFNDTDVYSPDYDYHQDKIYALAKGVVYCLLLTVAVAGVCGNVVVLVAWCAEPAYNPTVFLIKCLAVSDILLLLLWCEYFLRFFRLRLHALYYFRMVTAHTTLGVVVTRWVAVHKPLRADSLLTKRRVVVGYVLMLLWCLIPVIYVTIESGSVKWFIITITVEALYLALPILLLVALNVSLVLTLRSLIRDSNLGQQQQQQQSQQQPMAQLQYLMKAVLCVSISTVLAYPAGIVCRAFLLPALDLSTDMDMCGFHCKIFWIHLSVLLEVINSSVNIIYYFLFAPRFRQRCRRGCRRCRCCRWQSEDGRDRQSDAMQMTVVSGVQ